MSLSGIQKPERTHSFERPRPTSAPQFGEPYPGHMIRCPNCNQTRFDWMSWDYGACERRRCGYEWHGAGHDR